MTRLKPYSPAIALGLVSIFWLNYSTIPVFTRVAESERQLGTMKASITEWEWIESTSLPSASSGKTGRLSIGALADKVSASRVILVRLGESPGNDSRFDVKSDFQGLLRFMRNIADDPCELRTIRKSYDGTLQASFVLRER